MWRFFRRKGDANVPRGTANVPLEEQLRTLAACGIGLAPGLGPEALAISFDRTAFESDPYRLALVVMGSEAETEAQATPSGYLSDQIWHFDTECIEDHGAYATITARLKTLAQGALPLEQVEDYVDVEEGQAWVGFRLDDQPYRWEAQVKDDWVDPTILSRFAALLAQRQQGRRFTYIDLGGQDCLIGCSSDEQRSAHQAATGLKVEWLT
jgi:hypothetical protein